MTQGIHQRTIGIIVPEALRSGAYAPMLERIQQSGLTLSLVLRRTLTKHDIGALYRDQRDAPTYAGFLDFMTASPCLLLILEGPNAISRFQELIGTGTDIPTDSLRGQFPLPDHPHQHLIYASTNPAAALHDYQLLFSGTDLHRLKASA